jgi:hypothetical protein
MKTAVDWLVDRLYMVIPNEERNFLEGLRIEALEKEKEQFDDMFDEGFESAYQHFVNGKGFVKFEDYYNQTYNQNK